MNAYTVALLALQTEQKRFPREMVARLVEYIEAMRQENARLRNNLTIEIEGRQYEIERDMIAPSPLDVSDDEVLFFEPVPIVVLREKP